MLGLTIHLGAVVYCIPTDVCASQDAFTRLGSTGRTALSILDYLSLPALAQADTVLAAAISPAAFGLPELTEAVFMVPLQFATISLRGHATPRWIDIQTRAMRAWNITPAFRVGVASSLHYTSAPGFDAHLEAFADIHAVVVLDSDWTASCLAVGAVRLGSPIDSPLHGPRIHAALARNIGAWVASVDLALVGGQAIGIMCEAAYLNNSTLRWRASFCTSPFVLCAAVAVPLHDELTLVCEIVHVEHLGYRTMLGVEFVP